MATQHAAQDRVPQETANERFKRSLNEVFFVGILLATVLHFAFLQFFPELTAQDISFTPDHTELIDVPEVDIPEPPERIILPKVPKVGPVDLDPDITKWRTVPDDSIGPPPPRDPDRIGERPVFTPMTVRPELKNRARAAEIVERNYPKILQEAGIGGTVFVWVFIDTDGRVQNAQVQKSSGYAALDQAALESVYEFEFTPALNMDKKVEVWVAIDITFQVAR